MKRQRIETDEPVETAKYPFINHDEWMEKYIDWIPSKIEISSETTLGSVGTSAGAPRPMTLWFGLGADSTVSPQARSAQHSTVAHSPLALGAVEDGQGLILYSKWEMLERYIEHRCKLPETISHAYVNSELFYEALVADVVSNGIRRDPTLYKSVWPTSFMSVPGPSQELDVCDLAIAQTFSIDGGAQYQYRLPWVWEKTHRREFLVKVIEGIHHSNTDLIIPFHGLFLSPWTGGILFRLAQLFSKVAIVRSQLAPSWDDRCFICCIGKRQSNKFVDKATKLLSRLVPVENQVVDAQWGYSVPPVCFTDPCFTDWLRSVNAQLIGAGRAPKDTAVNMTSIYKQISQFRLKKFLFPRADKVYVGFYFGSFNPIHENHFALALFAREHLGLHKVVFIPNNDDNEEKKDTLIPLSHRVEMLKARSADCDWMEVLSPSTSTRRWESKAEIAETKTSQLFEESEMTGLPALILGQDSWNKAVLGSSRDKVTRHFIGISKLVKTKFFIFPRSQESTDGDLPVLPAPKPIRDNVQVVEGYEDPIHGLSSSRIRELFHTGQSLQETPEGLHPRVFKYISDHSLYRQSK